jgi:hypothetical protein
MATEDDKDPVDASQDQAEQLREELRKEFDMQQPQIGNPDGLTSKQIAAKYWQRRITVSLLLLGSVMILVAGVVQWLKGVAQAETLLVVALMSVFAVLMSAKKIRNDERQAGEAGIDSASISAERIRLLSSVAGLILGILAAWYFSRPS